MITTGSKFFFGLAAAAFGAAITYGIITSGFDSGGVVETLSGDGAINALLGPLTLGYKGGVGDHIGYSVLMGFAFATLGLGVATSAFRDADATALAELDGVEAIGAVGIEHSPSYWPVAGAFGIALVVVGLATSPVTFIIGLITLTIVAIEWTITVWAEQISGDQAANKEYRTRLLGPIEVPVIGLLGAGIVVFCFSRIFLAVSKAGSVWVALALGAVVFIGALLMASRPEMKRNMVAAVVVVGALVVLGVGIAGGVAGTREVEEHHEETETEHSQGAPVAPAPGEFE